MQMERQEARSRPELHVPGPHPPCIRGGWEAMDTVNLKAEPTLDVRARMSTQYGANDPSPGAPRNANSLSAAPCSGMILQEIADP